MVGQNLGRAAAELCHAVETKRLIGSHVILGKAEVGSSILPGGTIRRLKQ